MQDRLTILTKQAHSKPNFEKYEGTMGMQETNCYSHALGLTFPNLQWYRIGAISGKKAIDEKYRSINEIKNLLFSDCETLQLKIEESSLEDEVLENQYKIALFVKIWGNKRIGDYHFWRCDSGVWTEKWVNLGMRVIQDFKRDKMRFFPWEFVGIYKISR